MHLRTSGLVVACAAGLLALPAAASAASTSIIAGPVKVKGYSMAITATDDKSDSLSVMLNRAAGKASQSHFYTFSQGVKIATKGNLSAATIKADLGKYGKIGLKLGGVGPAKRGAVPKGCTGTAAKMRAGTLNGAFKLVADKTYFKTISAKSLKAQLFKGGSLTCDGVGAGGGNGAPSSATTLTSTIQGADGMLMLTARKDVSGAVTQTVMRIDDATKAAPASVSHFINAPGTASAFSAANDLSSATGSGVSPFLSGGFNFAAEFPVGNMSTGTLTGDLIAKFDSIGTQQIAAGTPDAMLMKN